MLNLISDAWIPVRRISGSDVIRPDQIAEPDVLFPDWPRADLNLACLELLVGLVYLACPPKNATDWKKRPSDTNSLRAALEPLTPAFNLLGDGPRFLQDFDLIEGSHNPPDMLFIDSAGDITAKKNADLVVKRARYPELDPEIAAMALFTLQAFAPSGGAGNLTSVRRGAPMVTLVRPEADGLWPLVWANVPEGFPLGADELEELPWMRPTKPIADPLEGDMLHPEVLFGQPRRLRLLHEGPRITGVIQTPRGTKYEGWIHPLSPYYHAKNQVLPNPPKPGTFGYRNWRGIVLRSENTSRAKCLEQFLKWTDSAPCRLLVGGWAMSNMSPLDFIWSEAPVFPFDPDGEDLAERLVEAAGHVGNALAYAVREVRDKKDKKGKRSNTMACERARERFFIATQTPFEMLLLRAAVSGQRMQLPDAWLAIMRNSALSVFDSEVMPGLADMADSRRQKAIAMRGYLISTFQGYSGLGRKIFRALEFPLPKRKPKEEANT